MGISAGKVEIFIYASPAFLLLFYISRKPYTSNFKLIAALVCMIFSLNAFACSYASSNETPSMFAIVTVTNPETNEQTEVTIPVNISSVSLARSSNDGNIYHAEAEIILDADALALSEETSYGIREEIEIKMTAGFNYIVSSDGHSVSLTQVFATYNVKNHDLYYTTNRRVAWMNSGGAAAGDAYPTSTSYVRNLNGGFFGYVQGLPPQVYSECTVRIVDMSVSRDVNLTFQLSI